MATERYSIGRHQQSEIPTIDLRIISLRETLSRILSEPDALLLPGRMILSQVEILAANSQRPRGEQCIEFAFGLQPGDTRVKSEVLNTMHTTYTTLTEQDELEPGDLVEYYRRDETFSHIAVVEGNGLAISKFGYFGPVCRHPVDIIPDPEATIVVAYRPPTDAELQKKSIA